MVEISVYLAFLSIPMQIPIIKDIWPHRHIAWQFARREIEVQTRGSLFGLFWFVFNPLLHLGLYAIVFGLVMGGSFRNGIEAGPFDFPLGIFLGLTVLSLINEAMSHAPSIILGQSNLVLKVVFPLQILSISSIAACLFRFTISIFLLFAGLLFLGPGLHWDALLFPFIIIPLAIMALGLSWGISALSVYFRDNQHFISFFTMLLFYCSAIFYPPSRIPESIWIYLRYNPVLHAVNQSRNLLLWKTPVDWSIIANLYLLAFVIIILGYTLFRKLQSGFADVI